MGLAAVVEMDQAREPAARMEAMAAVARAAARVAAAMVEVVRAACTPEGRNPYSPYRKGTDRTLHLHRRPGSCHRLRHYTC